MKRALLILAVLLLAPLSRAQLHFIGTGEAMQPTLLRGNRITVWPADMKSVREGQVVARMTDRYTIATRLRTYDAAHGWVTRADSVNHDDPGFLTNESLLGLVYLDMEPNGPQPRISGPEGDETHDLYILNPVYPVAEYAAPVGDYCDAPSFGGGGWCGPSWGVPDPCAPDLRHPFCPHLCVDPTCWTPICPTPWDPKCPKPPVVVVDPQPPAPPTRSVPEGGVFIILGITVLGMIAARRHFGS